MKKIIFSLILLVSALQTVYSEEILPLKRYGLFIGANNGGEGRVTLRYAVKDAEELAGILGDLGGLEVANTSILRDPDINMIQEELGYFRNLMADEKPLARRLEFVFYYSGHASEQGFLLGEEELPFSEIRQELGALGADVKIAIIDACYSGAITRSKGGTQRSPFLVDESSRMQGHAYLTSSSEDEASQESDLIGGSFFTHYLISGLRGAADDSGDGKVTLNELYEHAFSHTLNSTESTLAGPQHPSYDIQLTGTGDLVLSDLSLRRSSLILDETIQGNVFVRSSDGYLISELRKNIGQEVSLALEPGTYQIRMNLEDQGYVARITLIDGQTQSIDNDSFTPTELERNVVRGDQTSEDSAQEGDYLEIRIPMPDLEAITVEAFESFGQGETESSDFRPITISLLPGLNPPLNTAISVSTIVGADLNVSLVQMNGIGGNIDGNLFGAQLSGIFNSLQGGYLGTQLAGIYNSANGPGIGYQGAGIFNITGNGITGAQVAGIYNSSEANGFFGAQVAGIFNSSKGLSQGFQGAGIFNSSTDMIGVQAAGIFNGADQLSGVQFGLINWAGSGSGVQVGLINIADEFQGVPIGLINIGPNLRMSIRSLQSDSTSWYGLVWRNGSFYSSINYGFDNNDFTQYFKTNLSMGLHLSQDWFFWETELGLKSESRLLSQFDFSPIYYRSFNPVARLSLGFDAGGLTISGGIEATFAIEGASAQEYLLPTDNSLPWDFDGLSGLTTSNFFIGVSLF